jgi:WhiB family redox-sensing transcriptional regulator
MQFKGIRMPAAGLGDWRSRALCRQVDPKLFFPARNGSSREAVRVCRGCPVQVECLIEALVTGDRYGIRAGLSGRQRRTLVRRRRAQRAARAAGAPSTATVVAVGGVV